MSFMLADVTSLPTWAALTLGFGSPALGAAIALLGQRVGNRAATELEARSKREEVMRTLRWAAELAVSNDARGSLLGTHELQALRKSKLLSAVEEGFIYAALEVVIEDPRQTISDSAEEIEVILEGGTNVTEETAVPSEAGGQRGEANI